MIPSRTVCCCLDLDPMHGSRVNVLIRLESYTQSRALLFIRVYFNVLPSLSLALLLRSVAAAYISVCVWSASVLCSLYGAATPSPPLVVCVSETSWPFVCAPRDFARADLQLAEPRGPRNAIPLKFEIGL